jgi:uncharacterized protein YegP (UPF0339 family)
MSSTRKKPAPLAKGLSARRRATIARVLKRSAAAMRPRAIRGGHVWIYTDLKGQYRWRFKVNGNIMADSGEAYTRRRQAVRAWDRFAQYLTRNSYTINRHAEGPATTARIGK